MARTLAELEAMRDKLEDARFSGLRSVSYAGREVTYTSDSEIKNALHALNRKISDMRKTAPSTVRFSTSKGL